MHEMGLGFNSNIKPAKEQVTKAMKSARNKIKDLITFVLKALKPQDPKGRGATRNHQTITLKV